MVLQRHRGEATLQIFHLGNQPTGENGHQGTHEHHVAHYRQQGGDNALPGAHVISQVTRIGQAQKRPPDGVPGTFKLAGLGQHHQQTANQRDQRNKATDHQQLKASPLDQLALHDELDPINNSKWQHSVPYSVVPAANGLPVSDSVA